MKIKKEKISRHRSSEDYPVCKIKINVIYFKDRILL